MSPKRTDWSTRLILLGMILLLAVFWTVAAYGISHWRGAPFSKGALAAVFTVTAFLALFVFALLNGRRD